MPPKPLHGGLTRHLHHLFAPRTSQHPMIDSSISLQAAAPQGKPSEQLLPRRGSQLSDATTSGALCWCIFMTSLIDPPTIVVPLVGLKIFLSRYKLVPLNYSHHKLLADDITVYHSCCWYYIKTRILQLQPVPTCFLGTNKLISVDHLNQFTPAIPPVHPH